MHYVDETHVALSNQFFSKTATNVARNGLATVMVVDGYSGQQHVLDLVFERSETESEIFERVAIHLAILESRMTGIMKLRAVDIYRVEDSSGRAGRQSAGRAGAARAARPDGQGGDG